MKKIMKIKLDLEMREDLWDYLLSMANQHEQSVETMVVDVLHGSCAIGCLTFDKYTQFEEWFKNENKRK
jgi:hypothetical protein